MVTNTMRKRTVLISVNPAKKGQIAITRIFRKGRMNLER